MHIYALTIPPHSYSPLPSPSLPRTSWEGAPPSRWECLPHSPIPQLLLSLMFFMRRRLFPSDVMLRSRGRSERHKAMSELLTLHGYAAVTVHDHAVQSIRAQSNRFQHGQVYRSLHSVDSTLQRNDHSVVESLVSDFDRLQRNQFYMPSKSLFLPSRTKSAS